jgi:hypothetical protein
MNRGFVRALRAYEAVESHASETAKRGRPASKSKSPPCLCKERRDKDGAPSGIELIRKGIGEGVCDGVADDVLVVLTEEAVQAVGIHYVFAGHVGQGFGRNR